MPTPPLTPPSLTKFQKKVYHLTSLIPKGKVSTYKALSEALDSSSPRAVGQALKRNPFAPKIPCHRVIPSSLTLGGYKGHTSGSLTQKKESLLRSEGVSFLQGKLLNPENHLYTEFPNTLA